MPSKHFLTHSKLFTCCCDFPTGGNQPIYTVSDAGTVIPDNVTGLIWQGSADVSGDSVLNYEDKLCQNEALTYCENLELEDRSNWHSPSIKDSYSSSICLKFEGVMPVQLTNARVKALWSEYPSISDISAKDKLLSTR